MTKTTFLATVRAEVQQVVESVVAPLGRTTKDCPYLEFVFDFLAGRSARQLERILRQFTTESLPIETAQDAIPIVAARVRRSAEVWARTGRIVGLPHGLPRALPTSDEANVGSGGVPIGTMPEEGTSSSADPSDLDGIRSRLGMGHPLEGSVRVRMEGAFGHDFSGVRMHTDSNARQLSNNMNARAFTIGNDVAFGPGEYRPGTLVGDALIAHELAHVVQQDGVTKSVPERQEGALSSALEGDADKAAAGAVVSLWSNMRSTVSGLSRTAVPRLRSGLRLQRCQNNSGQATPAPTPAPAPAPAPPAATAGSIGSVSISGGVTGLTMNVTGTYSDCSACTDGMEAIQVFWGTRRTDGVQVGTHQTTFPPSAVTYDSFVDGGANSPGGAVYSGNHPYYIGRTDLPASYGHQAAQGSAGSVSGCTVNPHDTPGAATLHDEAFFETAFVCLNHNGSGSDKLLDAFKWGFVNRGTDFQASPGVAPGGGIVTASAPSTKFTETLTADYPSYSFT